MTARQQHGSTLNVDRLEPRELPAVGLLAEVRSGIWGSYPRDFTASGDRVYFAADNGHGEELYVTNGAASGTRMVKELRPGSLPATPTDLTPAGNRVLFFRADDGTGRALWRTDGTAAGTVKVPGMPAGALTNEHFTVGHNGSLYFTVQKNGTSEFWRTDGTAPVLLATTSGYVSGPYADNGKVYFPSTGGTSDGTDLWVTDGTAAGTRIVAARKTVTNPAGTTSDELRPQVELSGGRWLMRVGYREDKTTEFWVRDSATSEPRLLKSFPPILAGGDPYEATYGVAYAVSGRALFRETKTGGGTVWWVTDGTVEGTKPLAPLLGDSVLSEVVAEFGDRLLAVVLDPRSMARYVLTDGTPAGTTEVPGHGQSLYYYYGYIGQLSPSAAYPDGLMVFRGSKVVVSDGTAAGTRQVDAAGVPENAFHAIQGTPNRYRGYGPALGNSVFFQGPRVGNVRPEPWKWDMLSAPPQATPPTVASVKINDGAGQRSMVTKLTVTFDRAVDLADGAFDVRRIATNVPVGLSVSSQVVSGRTVATITFTGTGIVGGSLADGVYKLTVNGAKVRTAGTTTAMVGDHTTSFHRLFGDLDADRHVGAAARAMVHDRLGATRGDADYLAGFDYDSDGDIDAGDEYQVLKRYGKSV